MVDAHVADNLFKRGAWTASSTSHALSHLLHTDLNTVFNNKLDYNNNNISSLASTSASSTSAFAEPFCSEMCSAALSIVAAIIMVCVIAKCAMTYCLPSWLKLRQRFDHQFFDQHDGLRYFRRAENEQQQQRRHSISIISERSGSHGAEPHNQMTVTSTRQLDTDLIEQYLRCSYGEIFLQIMPPSYDDAQKEEELQHCNAATITASEVEDVEQSPEVITVADDRTADMEHWVYNNWRQDFNIYDYYRMSVSSAEQFPINVETPTNHYQNTADGCQRHSIIDISRELDRRLMGSERAETHRFRILNRLDSIPAPPDDFDDFTHCPAPPSYPNSARPSLVLAAARGSTVSIISPLRKISETNTRRSSQTGAVTGAEQSQSASADNSAQQDIVSASMSSFNQNTSEAYNAAESDGAERSRGQQNATHEISVARRTCDTIVEETHYHTETD